jgi:hypothetical protein
MLMYSPRIREKHIPGLYRLARSRGIPMTALVDEVLSAHLAQPDVQEEIAAVAIPAKPGRVRTPPSALTREQKQATRVVAGQESAPTVSRY